MHTTIFCFTRAMPCISAAVFAVAKCPSVCHDLALCQNVLTYRLNFFTTRQVQHSIFMQLNGLTKYFEGNFSTEVGYINLSIY